MHARRLVCLLFASCGVLLTACGVAPRTRVAGTAELSLRGSVYGGQQPVANSTIQLYAASTTATADGAAATPLISQVVQTGAGGGFGITALYTCPSASTPVYLTATGGNPGLAQGTNNPQIALMSALGPCGNLSAASFVSVNEVTTVAAVNALAPFMSSFSAVGSTAADASALNAAFTLASEYADSTAGVTPGPAVPNGYAVPSAEINTLANIIATCINSTGGTSASTNCGTIFGLVTPAGTPAASQPTDSIAALLTLAKNPAQSTGSLYSLTPPGAPFQPVLTQQPANFAVALVPVPVLTITPSTVTFASAAVSYPAAQQTVTIQNTGNGAATFASIGISGANAADFSQVSNCASPLVAGASCQVLVTATPSAVGLRTGSLDITSNAAASAQSVALNATGGVASAGPVTLSTNSLSWTQVGPYQDVTISNYGATALSIKSVTATSTFSIVANNCGSVLPAQSLCTVSLTAPTIGFGGNSNQPLTYTGTLTITDDAAAGPQVVNLSSTNYETLYSPPSPTVPVGQTYSDFVQAIGSYYAPVSYVGSISGTAASDYSFTPCQNGPQFGYCDAGFTFTPSTAGLRAARLVVASGYFPLNGVGGSIQGPQGPLFTASSSAFTAYIGYSGYAQASASFSITNNGSTTLDFASYPVYSANPGVFTVSASCTSVAPGTTCSGTISFGVQVTGAGTYTGSLVLKDAASGTQQTVGLTAYAAYPYPVITPSGYTFPSIPAGTTSSHTFTVADYYGNPLGHAITLMLQPAQNNPYSLSTTSCPASTTTPCTFTVTFAPTAAGSYVNIYSVQVLDTTSSLGTSVQLQGSASATGTAAVSLSPASVTFATRPVGSTSIATTVTLTNSGTGMAPLAISSIAVSGAVNGNFSQTNNCPASLATGAGCTISVTFAPVVAGSQSATLQVVSNAGTSPDSVGLSGTAQ